MAEGQGVAGGVFYKKTGLFRLIISLGYWLRPIMHIHDVVKRVLVMALSVMNSIRML
ncbi:hypothetical protein [Pseudomonas sp. MRSN 12121]|uniref:hypothetical protein n=1 Tax=Pseudomonas sp. MRSN 12121 TaxID=1611770 RepID=UPI000A518C64|nr:hypothetical protein [Pseudomonas sp. MRSN 12121]